ncbi:MAG: hypothetical protein ACRC1O_09330, partial [Ralstonia mannitolilytica]
GQCRRSHDAVRVRLIALRLRASAVPAGALTVCLFRRRWAASFWSNNQNMRGSVQKNIAFFG